MRRRILLGTGAAVITAATVAGYRRRLAEEDLVIPAAPAGQQRLLRLPSAARGRTVDVYTAVPAGYGAGAGLPVCLILHGGSKRPADFAGLGLGRFLTDAVRRGAPPFVLVGADGDRLAWRPSGGDDPQRMVHEEVPAWCRKLGYDTDRMAAWGWSMGGYGALLLAEAYPGFVRAVAAFSPAVRPGDDVSVAASLLRGTPVGLWCGKQDSLYYNVRALAKRLPEKPAAGGYADGRHNFGYWSRCVPNAFDFVAGALRP
ncbi:enterochelin esterase-like enzyme [Actinoplanes tereljensis]|uniref:alpha/beta hydrolase n=1 Tax=Paractinoplanes tereljensis TaxID=571912 RepID=UPI0019439E9A|nr:alpha/beta hydrolase-fold protein [Actinoplanes tereljensis]